MQEQVYEIFLVLRRRIRVILSTTILVSVVCIIGAFTLPRKYESSTTIFIRPDQTLNPLAAYQVTMAAEEQLRNFDEIIHSRALLLSLADSLGLLNPGMSEFQQSEIIKVISANISTSRLGSDSFRLGYTDNDPHRAQRAAQTIANLFIFIKTSIENRQNEYTVQFYENKVETYKQLFEIQSRALVNAMKESVKELPMESSALYERINSIEREIAASNQKIQKNREALRKLELLVDELKDHPEKLRLPARKEDLYTLLQEELPLITDLRTLVDRYDETSRRYTQNHPSIGKLENQISEFLGRMRQSVVAENASLRGQQLEFEKRRTNIIEELKKYSTINRKHEEQQPNYEAGSKMYEEMKLKLEQARLSQEVGSRGANQFVIFDPAYYPTKPTKPNRILIVASGFGGGIFLGLLLALAAEMFDSTIRRPRDMELYEKPVLALLPERKTSE